MSNYMSDIDAGGSGHVARLGGVYSGTYASVPNVDATETTFISRTMPANFWPDIGAEFLIESVIQAVTGGSGRRVKIYVGANAVYDSGAFVASAGGALHFRLVAFRIDSTIMACFTSVSGHTLTDFLEAQYSEQTVNFAAGITIAVKGQASASGDLIYRIGSSRYYPPPSIITLP